MTDEDRARAIIEAANPGFALGAPDHAHRLITKIVVGLKAEREACAKVAEAEVITEPPTIYRDGDIAWNDACYTIARTIRNRS